MINVWAMGVGTKVTENGVGVALQVTPASPMPWLAGRTHIVTLAGFVMRNAVRIF